MGNVPSDLLNMSKHRQTMTDLALLFLFAHPISFSQETQCVNNLRQFHSLHNVTFMQGDAYGPEVPAGSFDLAHARLLLINLKDPERAVAELVALVRPGGLVVVQAIDQVPWLCEPPHPAWDALVSAFLLIWRENGLDPLIGRRLPALLRSAGLVDVEVEVHGRADPPGVYHRKHLLALIGAVKGEMVHRGLFTETELAALTRDVESHLDAPQPLVTRPLLFQAWGRKPT